MSKANPKGRKSRQPIQVNGSTRSQAIESAGTALATAPSGPRWRTRTWISDWAVADRNEPILDEEYLPCRRLEN